MSGLFSKSAPPVLTQTPVADPPPRMPDPTSPEALAAARNATLAAGAAGRQSTMLTTVGSKAASTLAGGAATTKLGG